jgi:A/G-specific adenine glycosylase
MSFQNNFTKIHQKLLDWFIKNQRQLPFRQTKNPYYIWVSEVMLQQTRVASMLDSYDNFIKKFPTITALASAKEEEVLHFWRGLGYYSRALNLQKGAIYLLTHHNGEFPKNLEEVLKIPGIGSYTARAILSIAYDLPYAVLDGNVKRVLARVFYYTKNINTTQAQKELQILAEGFLNYNSPANHNQAIMELGASLCGKNPSCMSCPLNEICEAYKKCKQQTLPITKKTKEKKQIQMHFLLLMRENHVLLIKDSQRRFFKKIYSLPFWIEAKNLTQEYSLKYPFINKLTFVNSQKLPQKHNITHHEIEILLHTSYMSEKIFFEIKELEYKFVPLENLESHFPSSISKKIMNFLKSDFLF